jgi:hypothetical protein
MVQARQSQATDVRALLDLATPRAYYLFSFPSAHH